jgi:hypothetical protein
MDNLTTMSFDTFQKVFAPELNQLFTGYHPLDPETTFEEFALDVYSELDTPKL